MNESDQLDRFAEARYRKILDNQPEFVWRRFNDGEELVARVFFPEGHDKANPAPSIVFFHGGMWQSLNDVEFVPWALQLVRHGIVCILPQYRTRRNFEVHTADLLDEAREMWLWVYENAGELGLSQDGITLAGSDLGGLMALHASMSEQTTTRKWFRKVVQTEPQPAAAVLFRGVTGFDVSEVKRTTGAAGEGTLEKLAPKERLRKKLPVLFASHGDQDKLLSWRKGEHFARLWKKAGNKVLFVRVPHADHAYYHFNVNAVHFEHVLVKLTNFMREQGIWKIEGEGTDFLLL